MSEEKKKRKLTAKAYLDGLGLGAFWGATPKAAKSIISDYLSEEKEDEAAAMLGRAKKAVEDLQDRHAAAVQRATNALKVIDGLNKMKDELLGGKLFGPGSFRGSTASGAGAEGPANENEAPATP